MANLNEKKKVYTAGSNSSETSANMAAYVNDKMNNGIVDQATLDAMNKKFTTSAATQQAMQMTQGMLEQINNYKGTYADQIGSLVNQIMNRDKFQYDPNSDQLFQNALQSAMANGQQAMRDTIGQAASLTGGYGSSYATSAANQTYNQYIQSAYDNLPQFYGLARSAYDAEGQNMRDNLSMLQGQDDAEFNRLYNQYTANAQYSDTLYGRDFNEWSAGVDQASKYAAYLQDEYSTNLSGLQGVYSAQSNAEQFAQEMAYNYAKLAEDQRQFNAQLAENQRQFNESLAAQKAAAAAKAASSTKSASSGSTKTGNAVAVAHGTGLQVSQSLNNQALKAYQEGGEVGLEIFLDKIDDSKYDLSALIDYAHSKNYY